MIDAVLIVVDGKVYRAKKDGLPTKAYYWEKVEGGDEYEDWLEVSDISSAITYMRQGYHSPAILAACFDEVSLDNLQPENISSIIDRLTGKE